jgi:hypothetical protein
MSPTVPELVSNRLGSIKLNLVSIRIINELFVNIIICSNIKRDILV